MEEGFERYHPDMGGMHRKLFYGEVWGVEGKGDGKPLGVCGWLTTGVL